MFVDDGNGSWEVMNFGFEVCDDGWLGEVMCEVFEGDVCMEGCIVDDLLC